MITFDEIMELDYLTELEQGIAEILMLNADDSPQLRILGEDFRTIILPESGNSAKELAKARILTVTRGLTGPEGVAEDYAHVYELLKDLLDRI